MPQSLSHGFRPKPSLVSSRNGPWAGPAVAVAQVDHEVGALDVRLDAAPGGVRREHAAHVHALGLGLPGDLLALVEVLLRGRRGGPDDDHGLHARGVTAGAGRARRGR